jgi:hypothetical protein
VELFRRIETVSLHSKPLTDGKNVTTHEEAWSTAPPPPGPGDVPGVFVANLPAGRLMAAGVET